MVFGKSERFHPEKTLFVGFDLIGSEQRIFSHTQKILVSSSFSILFLQFTTVIQILMMGTFLINFKLLRDVGNQDKKYVNKAAVQLICSTKFKAALGRISLLCPPYQNNSQS